tara:strand:- start:226 stop:1041 length:816 start_codon:yes stop_codon:yes gene_type:complete
MSDFGVFYKCFKETKAIEHSLESLFSFYPKCPVYLVSDGGNDYSYLEEKYPTLKAIQGDDNRGWMLSPGGCSDIVFQFKVPEIHERFRATHRVMLERIKSAVDYCDKKHMLFMEPDVLVRGELTIPPDSHLLGVVPQPNIDYSAGWVDVLREVEGANLTVGWSWPIIFSSEAFSKMYSFVNENDDVLRKILLSDLRPGIADDVWIPILLGAAGYKQEHNPEVTECNRNPGWKTSHHPLVHEYREKYPKAGEDSVGRHTAEEHVKDQDVRKV